ncbi:Phosphotransferase enzyme [Coccidioides immitis]|nr:Phosphotransferase enzyme [Coccidioides immitis]
MAARTPTNEHLFSYTSGRFLFNEDRRRQERYVEFDVEAFKELAAQGIEPGHGKVAHIAKFAEGGFNRVFLLTMDDGFQAIAKIPYKIALPKRHATASEAATLEFLRLKGIPVQNFTATLRRWIIQLESNTSLWKKSMVYQLKRGGYR